MKTFKYIAAAMTIMAAVSCQDKIAPEQNHEIVTFTAGISAETKAVMGDATIVNGQKHYPVYWKGTEKFSIFDDQGTNQEFVGYSRDADKNGIESSSIEISGTGDFKDAALTSGNVYYALYPYNSKNQFNKDSNELTYRADKPHQQFVDTEHQNMPKVKNGQSLMFFASRTSDNNFSFTHPMAYIKFQIEEDGIYRVQIKDKNKNKIAANTHMTLNEEFSITNGSKEDATLYAGSDTEDTSTYFSAGTYYIAVIPVNLRIELVVNGTTVRNATNSVQLNPGTILNIGTVSKTMN